MDATHTAGQNCSPLRKLDKRVPVPGRPRVRSSSALPFRHLAAASPSPPLQLSPGGGGGGGAAPPRCCPRSAQPRPPPAPALSPPGAGTEDSDPQRPRLEASPLPGHRRRPAVCGVALSWTLSELRPEEGWVAAEKTYFPGYWRNANHSNTEMGLGTELSG